MINSCHPLVKSILQRNLLAVLLLSLLAWTRGAETSKLKSYDPPALIAPARPTDTGILLQPPLDLSKFTTEDFIKLTSTVGTNRIHKKWTNAIVTLPPHPRANLQGLTEQEIKDYMLQARRLFDDGDAIPVSDVGLISTQEDVIRRPMLNHISGFSNSVARVYLLVQKTSTDKGWGYFSIVTDLTASPPIDYFADLNSKEPKFQAKSCYKCHSSGPLAIHPAREDLVLDAPLAAALSKHIAKQPLANFHWPARETKPDYGQPLALDFCAKCHDTDAIRQPLYKIHFHPMRVLVDFGYMPPKHALTPDQISQLKSWLDQKP
jgi:hypothetical protein